MIRFDDLPSDPLLLKQKLIETMSIVAGAANENAAADGAENDTKSGAPDKAVRPRPTRPHPFQRRLRRQSFAGRSGTGEKRLDLPQLPAQLGFSVSVRRRPPCGG